MKPHSVGYRIAWKADYRPGVFSGKADERPGRTICRLLLFMWRNRRNDGISRVETDRMPSIRPGPLFFTIITDIFSFKKIKKLLLLSLVNFILLSLMMACFNARTLLKNKKSAHRPEPRSSSEPTVLVARYNAQDT